MADTLVGRQPELATIRAFLDRAVDAPRALVIDGDAGIGKSTLWDAAVVDAKERFARVLQSRPAEAEQGLAHVALGDLFADVGASLLADLPAPRRRAFEAALLLEGLDGPPVDPRALGAALLGILPALAADGPIILAIDDDQWADPASIASLSFALRRLPAAPILLLLARRVATPSDAPGLEAALDPRTVSEVRVGPLSLGGIQSLLRDQLGIALPRPALVRVHEASGGNPLFALELVRAHAPGELADPGRALRVPADLERLLGARIGSLPPASREALLLVAAHGRPSVGLLEQVGVTAALEPATQAGIVERSGDVVRFTHPLLASVVYRDAGKLARLEAHGRLSGHLDDPVHRARHLALGTAVPDEAVASLLEETASVARRRRSPIAAAELAEHAQRLTPPQRADPRQRRGLLAARTHLEAGDPARAQALANALLETASSPAARGEVLMLLAELESAPAAVTLLEEALREAEATPLLAAEIHERLADIGRFDRGRDWAEQHAREAIRLAESLEHAGRRAGALAITAVLRFERLEPDALGLAREAYRLAVSASDQRVLRQARWAVGHLMTWMHYVDEARDWLRGALEEIGDGDELARMEALWYLSLVELWAGNWELAEEHASESLNTSMLYETEQAPGYFAAGLVALHRGKVGLAMAHANRALAGVVDLTLIGPLSVLGMADAWEGRPEQAVARFDEAGAIGRVRGLADPSQAIAEADHIAALLQLGRVAEAESEIDRWEDSATRVGREWSLAEVVRSRGLLAAARGDLDGAVEHLEHAIRRHEAVGDAFGRARALLAIGGVRLRQRQKRLARLAFEAALEGFGALGAPTWIAATRRELARVGGRRRMEDLSPSERRVAELVAEGRTNREIAAALFLGERTVAGHLTSVYAKLGIRSRTELAGRLAQAGGPGEGAKSRRSDVSSSGAAD